MTRQTSCRTCPRISTCWTRSGSSRLRKRIASTIRTRSDRKIIYHEHAGLKTQEYRDGLMDKLQLVEALIHDRYFS